MGLCLIYLLGCQAFRSCCRPSSKFMSRPKPGRALRRQFLRMSEAHDDTFYLTPTLSRIQNEIKMRQINDRDTEKAQRSFSSTTRNSDPTVVLVDGLATSRLGLDPYRNTRHAPMVYHENYSFDNWPSSHTFPMDKFRQTAYSLLNDPDTLLSSDEEENNPNVKEEPLVLSSNHFYKPLSFTDFPKSYLSPPICPHFLHSFLSASLSREECRVIGFRDQTSRSELIERTVLEVAGTVLTAQLAMKYGLASHLAGGTHHAESARGKGFTILNDLAVVARLMTWKEGEDAHTDFSDLELLRGFYRGNDGRVDRVLVVDCDVHQGDGTATFHSVTSTLYNKLFTLDIHAESNYPHPKEKCTYDVPLPDNCNDQDYLSALAKSLDKVIAEVEPQLVLYNAGVDPYQQDKLGRLSLSWEGLQHRDSYVINKFVDKGIPIAVVVGGGYDVDVRQLGKRHSLVHRVCGKIWRKRQLWRC